MAKKYLIVLGTRPEVIKLAPVAWELQKQENVEVKLLVTGQHREMLDQALEVFSLKPDYDLNVMSHGQDLFDISEKILRSIKPCLHEFDPDCVIVQGDTTTTFVAALAAFYLKIPVAHVEAGLRTGEKYSPFPEEMNRMMTSCIASYHFAPTVQSNKNLVNEGIDSKNIWVTGNTAIDSLLWVVNNTKPDMEKEALWSSAADGKRIVLVTTHRRENFGQPMEDCLSAIRQIVETNEDVVVVMPVHYNPNVRQKVDAILKDHSRIILIDPLDYVNFCHLMNRSSLLITDSGGIQEEAPTLGKPILVMRESTERPEGVDAGTAVLVGSNKELIIETANELLRNSVKYEKMAKAANPYGDGQASALIVAALSKHI